MGKIADLFVKLVLDKKGFDQGIDGAKQKTSMFGEGVKKIGGLIAGAFAVGSVISFGKELLRINSEADGVRVAFSKMGDASMLQELRKATSGTVSDLNLMKRSVMASNFGIPIKDLGNLLAFAAKRAQDTGQSVDYLVDSIVLGIGRKSPLILDNLGISAIQLKAKLKGVSDEAATVGDVAKAVGEIASEEMQKTGAFIDNVGSKVQRLSSRWENYKEGLARSLAPAVSFVLSLLEKLSNQSRDNITDIKTERSEMNTAALSAMGLAEGTDKRRIAIENLKKLYPQYFSSLDSEKSKNEDVAEALRAANKEYANKIVLSQYEQELGKVAKAEERLENKRVNAIRSLQEFNEKYYGGSITSLDDLMKKSKEFIDYQNSGSADTKVAGGYLLGMQNAVETLEKYGGKLDDINAQKAGIDSARQSIEKLLGIGGSSEITGDGNTPVNEELQTAVERLAAIKKAADEIDAQRILNMDFYGEGMTAAPLIDSPANIGTPTADSNALGSMDSFYKTNNENLKKFTADQLQEWTDFTTELNEAIESGMDNAVASFASGVGELMVTGDWGDFGSGLLKTIGGFMQQMGGLFIAYAIASKGFAAAIGLGPANPMAWGLAMAAGVGLVAAGSAISALAGSGLKGSASSGGGGGYSGGYSGGSSQASMAVNVGGSFELHGTVLKAAIHNTDRKNSLIR